MADKLRLDILPEEQLRLFKTLSGQSFIKDFYLAGGTCLALQIGHRRSIDFDFFIPADFDTSEIVNILIEDPRCLLRGSSINLVTFTLINNLSRHIRPSH
jgi:hypothetical protein